MTGPEQRTTSRRTLVRGAAWSVPVVTAVAAAPAFAASPCVKTALQAVSWTGPRSTTSQTGTTASGTSVAVRAEYTATRSGGGSLNSANLTASGAVVAGDSFSIVNNSPVAGAGDANANYQTVTLTFTRPVFGLTFSIDDIDRATSSYSDQVSVSSTPAETPAALLGSAVAGAGATTDPWRTTGGQGDNAAGQSVTLTYRDGLVGVTALSIRLWSPVLPTTSAVHLVRIRQMQFRTCA